MKAFTPFFTVDECIAYHENQPRFKPLTTRQKKNLKNLFNNLGEDFVAGLMKCTCMCGRDFEMEQHLRKSALEDPNFMKDVREAERIKVMCPVCSQLTRYVVVNYGEEKFRAVCEALWGKLPDKPTGKKTEPMDTVEI